MSQRKTRCHSKFPTSRAPNLAGIYSAGTVILTQLEVMQEEPSCSLRNENHRNENQPGPYRGSLAARYTRININGAMREDACRP